MDSNVIIAAIVALASAGAALSGWGMWLENKAERRLMDIVAGALEAGQPVPPELLARLAGERAGGGNGAAPRRALMRTAMLFLGLALALFIGSWAVGDNEREQALLLVSAIAGLTGVALLVVQNFGRRVGL